MRVLFVYPEFPDTYWSLRHAIRFEGKRATIPPLGLMTVSALLPPAWERRLIDMNVRRLTPADLAWPDLVFISAMLVQHDSMRQVIEQSKAAGKRVVVGGPYPSEADGYAEALDYFSGADHIFIGEAEATLPEFVEDLERGRAKHIYQAAERPSLLTTPLPDFQLAELNRYTAMTVQYSRGCPFQCEFCDVIKIYGRVPRTKSNEQMLAELDALFNLGWRGLIFIVDDNFIGNKPNVKRLLPALAEWSVQRNHPFSFITEASVNLAEDEELLEGMRQAGFRYVFLGIETPVAESLKEARKMQNVRHDLLTSVRKIQSYGMEVMAGFIVGFDNDPDDVFELQSNFIRESAIPVAMLGLLNVPPATPLWERLKREGRLLDFSRGNNTDCSLGYIPKMDPARLIKGYKDTFRAIYEAPEYYQRALASLERVKQETLEPQRDGLLHQLLAFARIVLTLGIRDRDRREFWRYLRQVLKLNRKKFGQAVRLAALGYHFRRLAEFSGDSAAATRQRAA